MKKEIRRYIISTFSLSWLFWGIAILLTQTNTASFGNPLMLIPYILGGLAPAICEIYIKKKHSSKEEFRTFRNSIISPRHNIIWYILIILSAFICCFLPTLFGGATMVQPLYMAFLEFPFMIIGGGLEEIGWRGFLQPALQRKMSTAVSTLIVSAIWAVWHLPLWFIVGTNQTSLNFLSFLIIATALSFVLAALYNATQSIFLCIVMHALINGFWDVYRSNDYVLSSLPTLLFCLVIFVTVEILIKRTKLFSIKFDYDGQLDRSDLLSSKTSIK